MRRKCGRRSAVVRHKTIEGLWYVASGEAEFVTGPWLAG